jgi:hypothetical protein
MIMSMDRVSKRFNLIARVGEFGESFFGSITFGVSSTISTWREVRREKEREGKRQRE